MSMSSMCKTRVPVESFARGARNGMEKPCTIIPFGACADIATDGAGAEATLRDRQNEHRRGYGKRKRRTYVFGDLRAPL